MRELQLRMRHLAATSCSKEIADKYGLLRYLFNNAFCDKVSQCIEALLCAITIQYFECVLEKTCFQHNEALKCTFRCA